MSEKINEKGIINALSEWISGGEEELKQKISEHPEIFNKAKSIEDIIEHFKEIKTDHKQENSK